MGLFMTNFETKKHAVINHMRTGYVVMVFYMKRIYVIWSNHCKIELTQLSKN